MSLVMCTQLFCLSFKRHIVREMYTIMEALDDDVHLTDNISREVIQLWLPAFSRYRWARSLTEFG